MADDLDEEWWLEGEKQSEDVTPEGNENDTATVDQKKGRKRKREKVAATEPTSDDQKEQESSVKKKKKKKSKTISQELAENPAEPLKWQDLSEPLTAFYKGKLSPVEMDAVALEDHHFTACNDLSHTPSGYLSLISPRWQKKVSKMAASPGSPLMLILTSAAIRATQLNRDIAEFKDKSTKVVKLFAKHYKLEEQTKYLSKAVVHLGIGTPSRIQALIENDALHLDQVSHIVLDWSWRDLKLRRLVDVPEIKKDLFVLLKKHILPRVHENKAKLGLL